MKVLDMETIMICAVAAVIGTLGAVAGGAAFAGIRFQDCNPIALMGVCCGMSGLVWGILLLINSNRRIKRMAKHI